MMLYTTSGSSTERLSVGNECCRPDIHLLAGLRCLAAGQTKVKCGKLLAASLGIRLNGRRFAASNGRRRGLRGTHGYHTRLDYTHTTAQFCKLSVFRSSRPATELRRFEFKQAGAADASGGSVIGSGTAGVAAPSIAIQTYDHVRQLICMSHSVKY